MANKPTDFFNKSRVAKRTLKTNESGWLANAAKSIGYSASDIITEIMPATMGTIKSVSENSKDILAQLRQAKPQLQRLTKGFEQNAYVGLGKDIFKNSLEDLKSGKVYLQRTYSQHPA